MKQLSILNFELFSGVVVDNIKLSYELFGQALGTAPVVMINHALTGNSNVAGPEGWWSTLVGPSACIDTDEYTVLAFNIPGNGYDGFELLNYKDFISKDIARLFLLGLQELEIPKLYALIGGSLGGGIAWEMAVLKPDLCDYLIPVATDWKATDWLIANCQIQEQILLNSSQPVHDARMHAMLCYRTPQSFSEKFSRSIDAEKNIFNVESWLNHHGDKLQDRFELAAYRLMNQLLKTINVETRDQKINDLLQNITAEIHIVGVDSDLFFSAEENRQTYEQLAAMQSKVFYHEIHSVHGHDAFLIEYNQLEHMLEPIFKNIKNKKPLKVVKFGGKSLANGEGLDHVIGIIENKLSKKESLALVLSARGETTDWLEELLSEAENGYFNEAGLEQLITYQKQPFPEVNLDEEINYIRKVLGGVEVLRDYSEKVKDAFLAQGELMSIKVVGAILNDKGVSNQLVDTRELLVTNTDFGKAIPDEKTSLNKFRLFKKDLGSDLPIFTGFIGADINGHTTTLGRNGSNYSASLIANFLDADSLESYTHVSGIFTANPDLVPSAKQIESISYAEANEMANFGATILHAKTIIPLIEKNIPLRILNTFNDKNQGTLISSESSGDGIKALSVQKDMALINLEGRGLLGKVGVDARIFGALGKQGVSVGIISQGSSERGIGFVVEDKDAKRAKEALEKEFEHDFLTRDVATISILRGVAVLSVIGQDLVSFHKALASLERNNIHPQLINNTVTGKNICLVLAQENLNKAVNVIHGQIFGVYKTINLALFGKGLVGGTLIRQILDSQKQILERRKVKLSVFAVANSKTVLIDGSGIDQNWESKLLELDNCENSVQKVIDFAQDNHLENLIAVDNTASESFVENYPVLVEAGFDLVSSNKIGNTISYDFYEELRAKLDANNKKYLYETNVGAGLPLIDTLKLLHHSGENVTRIKGVFSGSLSYLFNTYSESDVSFSETLKEAIEKGFTEPDPREDLCGNDVGRKLLILARELDLKNEFEDIKIDNLIPEDLRAGDVNGFLQRLDEFDAPYSQIKADQSPDHVLRYIGDLSGDLSGEKGLLEVKLVSVPKSSSLGGVQGSDSIFEIYTESYGNQPLVIQGAGAGAEVTARGVLGDILRLTENAL
ncbi:bifunctional aspartate kinase/homoserine dehydrogenase I [Flavobacteriaceae bacterium]|nr:bifunctional aspartate kinase/homoserine dehydrogenase I [Flavobacteriaceae bacterium]